MPRILVVDDDPNLREVVRYALVREGYEVGEAGNGVEALRWLEKHSADLAILDVMMPEMDGLSLCQEIRKRQNLPIVFLSSRSEEIDRVIGLELGGDDYLPKPFSPRELISRIKAVLRRSLPTVSSPPSTTPGLHIDLDAHRVWAGEQEISLTATEFRLFAALMRRPGKIFTREDLIQAGYDGPHFVADRTLDSHIRGIRAKLRTAGIDPIETVHGVGWRLRDV